MLPKGYKQRTISELETDSKEYRGEIGVKVIEARLNVNVARMGAMNPYIKIVFGKEIWKTDYSTGMHPKWNEYHSFPFTCQVIELAVYDKGFILGDTEIGRCTIHLMDVIQGHSTEWWSVVSPKQEVTGGVLLSFEFFDSDSSLTHSSNSSWDLRSYNYAESSPIFPRGKKLNSMQITNFTPEIHRMQRFHTEPDEANKLEQVKFDLIEEDERLKTQETKVRLFFEKLKQENDKLSAEKKEVSRDTEVLRRKEQSILLERAELENEKLLIEQGKEELEKYKESISLSYSLLKMEKLRIRAQRRLLERNKKKMAEDLKSMELQKVRMLKMASDRMASIDRE